jgi:hypothetical protein
MARVDQVIVLTAAYLILILAFLVVYLAIRLRLRWSTRKIAAVVAVMAACELAAFLFLLVAGLRGWVP